MKNKLIIIFIVVIFIFFGVVAAFFYFTRSQPCQNNQGVCAINNLPVGNTNSNGNISPISSFFDCLVANYPILESYPRQCKTPDGRTFVEDIGNELEHADLIKVDSPRRNQEVNNPFSISGQARGNWFFEASFPVKIYDGQNNILGQTIATAQGEWMTTDFVPFTANLEYVTPTTANGWLVLEKDNPSGLPENDDELRVPITFKPEFLTVKVYLGKEGLADENFDCQDVIAVQRQIPKTLSVARSTLEELLKGPSQEEKESGFFSSINPGVKIQSLKIEDGIAKVDFDKQLEYQVGGSCRVAHISAQIQQTLKQFPTIKDVLISIDGRTQDILQP